jgi:hypothetical protein
MVRPRTLDELKARLAELEAMRPALERAARTKRDSGEGS